MKSTETSKERSLKRRETGLRSDSDKSAKQQWEAILVTEERDLG